MDNLHNSPFAQGIGVAAIIVVLVIGLLIFLVPMTFYILTLQKALNRCAPENRAMEPGLTWLLLVPCVNIIWHFFVVLNLTKTLAAEFQKRGIPEEPEPGKMMGLIASILWCCSGIPLLNYVFAPAGLVCWIIYWVKVAEFSRKLAV